MIARLGVVLDRSVARQIITLALRKAPEEMCGLLLSRQDSNYGIEFRALENVHEDPTRYYRMHGQAMTAVWEYAQLNGMDIAGIVHSHPHGVAYPSSTDIRLAAYEDIPYLIVSTDPRQLKAFILNGTYKQISLHVELSKWGLDYCWICHRYEDSLHAYKVCFECGHVYRSEQDLVDEHNKVLAEMDETVDVFSGYGDEPVRTDRYVRTPVELGETIWTCPMCCHDF